MSEPFPNKIQGRRWWTISLPVYGDFQYYGSPTEAENMRAAKAQWEGETATIREATDDEAKKGRAWQQWESDNGYPMDERQRESIEPLTNQDAER